MNFTFGLSIDRQHENKSKYNTIIDEGSSFGEYLTNQANNYLAGTWSPTTAFDWENEGSKAPFLSLLAYDQFAIVDVWTIITYREPSISMTSSIWAQR